MHSYLTGKLTIQGQISGQTYPSMVSKTIATKAWVSSSQMDKPNCTRIVLSCLKRGPCHALSSV